MASITDSVPAPSVFEAVARCAWDPSEDSSAVARASSVGGKQSGPTFERRGISLAKLGELADAGRAWPKLRRVLLKSGDECLAKT